MFLNNYDLLVNHEGADCDNLALNCTTLNESVLLIKEGNKCRPKMSSIAFSRKNEPKVVEREESVIEYCEFSV